MDTFWLIVAAVVAIAIPVALVRAAHRDRKMRAAFEERQRVERLRQRLRKPDEKFGPAVHQAARPSPRSAAFVPPRARPPARRSPIDVDDAGPSRRRDDDDSAAMFLASAAGAAVSAPSSSYDSGSSYSSGDSGGSSGGDSGGSSGGGGD